MKILTLNTWQERGPWVDRWDLILEGISQYQPDLIGFQEIFNPDWAKEMQKKTGYCALIFPQEHCGLTFVSRFPAKQWTCLTFKTQSPTEDYLRYALFAAFETPQGILNAFDTHLSWRIPESEIRQRQVEELLAFIQEKAEKNPAVVMGDFNSTPDSPEIKAMIHKGKFTDIYAKQHPGKPGITWNNKNSYTGGCDHPMPDRRIDFLFARNEGKVIGKLTDVKIIFDEPNADGVWPSDHLGVLAEWE